jgi:hypothetical protein
LRSSIKNNHQWGHFQRRSSKNIAEIATMESWRQLLDLCDSKKQRNIRRIHPRCH